MFAASLAWYRGLAAGGTARIGQLNLAQPFLAVAWSALLLGEHITWTVPVTAAIVLCCMAVCLRCAPAPGQAAVSAVTQNPQAPALSARHTRPPCLLTNGTVRIINGDFKGSSNITVQDSGYVDIQSFANPIWGSGEKWLLVSPKLPSASDDPGVPSAAVYDPSTGNTEVYATGSDGQLEEDYYHAGKWSGVTPLGGSITGTPSAVYDRATGNMEVYARDVNGHVEEDYYHAGKWSGLQPLGGSIAGSPDAIYNQGTGNMEVYVNGNGVLYEHYYHNGAWSGWQDLDNPGDPAITGV